MSEETENKPTLGRKPLGLKRSVEAGEVKQTFSHGRTNKVVVEVKRRANLDDALDAVTVEQRARLRRAADHIVAHRNGLRNASVRLDLIALAPGRRPRHLRDAWREA